jgi:hypothetical protein
MTSVVNKLDQWGRPAWIALMVAGFVVFFPLGLAILAYIIWSGRMACGSRRVGAWTNERDSRWERKMGKLQDKMQRMGGWPQAATRFEPTGNAAFDEYREETLKRLEQEANDFQDFLRHLRMARDKAEFDQYMAARQQRPDATPDAA